MALIVTKQMYESIIDALYETNVNFRYTHAVNLLFVAND